MTTFSNDPAWWNEAGRRDRMAGNELPAVTEEDFCRELTPGDAKACSEAYALGFTRILVTVEEQRP